MMSLVKRLHYLASEQMVRVGKPQDEMSLVTERWAIAGMLELQAEIVTILSELDSQYRERLERAGEYLLNED